MGFFDDLLSSPDFSGAFDSLDSAENMWQQFLQQIGPMAKDFATGATSDYNQSRDLLGFGGPESQEAAYQDMRDSPAYESTQQASASQAAASPYFGSGSAQAQTAAMEPQMAAAQAQQAQQSSALGLQGTQVLGGLTMQGMGGLNDAYVQSANMSIGEEAAKKQHAMGLMDFAVDAGGAVATGGLSVAADAVRDMF